jgi:hypothetical protein
MKFILIFVISMTIGLLIFNFYFNPKFNNKTSKLDTFDKILYIEESFSESEIASIKFAAASWISSTNHVVKLQVIQFPFKERSFNKAIIISRIKSKDIEKEFNFSKLFAENMVGFYWDRDLVPRIYIVYDLISNPQEYSAVVMHELGHSMGLNHDNENNTLMNAEVTNASLIITNKDIQQFCSLYKCH